MEIEANQRYLICPPLTFMKVPLEMDKYFKKIVSVLISGIEEDNMPDSETIFTNCHVSGVSLRSTAMNFIWSNLCLGTVHVLWEKTGKSSPLPSQPVPRSGIPTRKPGSHIPLCMSTIFIRQPDQRSPPLFFLFSSFLIRDYKS